jgi:hypothetical protein
MISLSRFSVISANKIGMVRTSISIDTLIWPTREKFLAADMLRSLNLNLVLSVAHKLYILVQIPYTICIIFGLTANKLL